MMNLINRGEVPLLRGGHVWWISLISVQNIAQQMSSAERVWKVTKSWTSMSCAVFRNVSSVTQKKDGILRKHFWNTEGGLDYIVQSHYAVSEGRWFAQTACLYWDCGICLPQSWQLAGTWNSQLDNTAIIPVSCWLLNILSSPLFTRCSCQILKLSLIICHLHPQWGKRNKDPF